jgi:hypothetical protein
MIINLELFKDIEWSGTEENHKETSARITSTSAEIRLWDFPNKKHINVWFHRSEFKKLVSPSTSGPSSLFRFSAHEHILISFSKVKVKLSLYFTKHHAMKTYWGSGGMAPRILDLGTRWRWVVSFMPRPLYPQGKSPWYPLDRRLGGPQSRYEHGGEEKNSQPLLGIEP